MIDLPLKKLRPGMVTAQSIYNSSGASYLTKGTELTKHYIDKLRDLGVIGLHVLNYSSEIKPMPPEDILSERIPSGSGNLKRCFPSKRPRTSFPQ